MIPKPAKNLNEVSSYCPISLLPQISKVFERLLLKRIKPLINHHIPPHQFGFREKHSTIEQVHRKANKINEAFERKICCSAVFLSQAFDKVWHRILI